MSPEDLKLQKRFMDLAKRCESNNQYTFTGFLSQVEQEVFFCTLPALDVKEFNLWGGYEEAERKVLRFGSPQRLFYEEEFPISCVMVEPASVRFAEKLTHRDILGALMNLGIERKLLGDILIKENIYYIICLSRIADYIVENLGKIKHTMVECKKSESMPEGVAPELKELNLIVSSLRADGIISKVFHLSRNESESLFVKGRVFINGREALKSSVMLKAGDRVSVRGYGKFLFQEKAHETRKGNISVVIQKYI